MSPVDGRTVRVNRVYALHERLVKVPPREVDASILQGALLETLEILAEEIAISPEPRT